MTYESDMPKRNLEALKTAFRHGYPVRFDYRTKQDGDLRQRHGFVREVLDSNHVVVADFFRRGYRTAIVDRIVGEVHVDTP